MILSLEIIWESRSRFERRDSTALNPNDDVISILSHSPFRETLHESSLDLRTWKIHSLLRSTFPSSISITISVVLSWSLCSSTPLCPISDLQKYLDIKNSPINVDHDSKEIRIQFRECPIHIANEFSRRGWDLDSWSSDRKKYGIEVNHRYEKQQIDFFEWVYYSLTYVWIE